MSKSSPKKSLAECIEPIAQPVRVALLRPSPLQPRQHFDATAITALADRVKQTGVLTPLIVWRPSPKNDELHILCGERRWRAAQQAGLDAVPCRLAHVDEQCAFQIALEDNEEREPLNCIEQAKAWQRAIKLKIYGPKAKDFAEHLGISPSTLSNQLAILKLPDSWQDVLARGQWGLTATHSRPLLQWAYNKAVLDKVWDRLAGNDVTVSVVELSAMLEAAALDLSRLAEPGEWGRTGGGGGYRCCLTEDECERDDLDTEIVTIGGQSMRVAWNVELWEQLNSAGKMRSTKPEQDATAEPASRKKRDDTNRDGVGKLKPTRSLFPADDPDATREQLRVFVKELLHAAVTHQLAKAEVVNPGRRTALLLALLLSFERPFTGAARNLRDAVRSARGVNAGEFPRSMMIDRIKDPIVYGTLDEMLVEVLSDNEGEFSLPEMQQLAAVIGVTAADGWICDGAFLEMLSLSQLLQLAKEWKRPVPNDKPGAMKVLRRDGGPRPYPKLLRDVEGDDGQ